MVFFETTKIDYYQSLVTQRIQNFEKINQFYGIYTGFEMQLMMDIGNFSSNEQKKKLENELVYVVFCVCHSSSFSH